MDQDVRFVSFASNEQETISLLIALRSLKTIKIAQQKPMVFIPKLVIEKFENDYPDIALRALVQGLNAKLVTPFPNGYNQKTGFRNVLGNIERRLGDVSMLYFAPTMVFRKFDVEKFTSVPLNFARSDDFDWPRLALYDPPLDEFWQSMSQLIDVDIQPWMDQSQPENYWRRYPSFPNTLYHVSNLAEFVNTYDEVSDTLQNETPRFLEGMGPSFDAATMAITAMRLGASSVQMDWEDGVYTYNDIIDLVLRMDNDQFQWLSSNVIRTNDLRALLKSRDETRMVFFQNRLRRTRENFDEVEEKFSRNRMQKLVENRKIRRRLKQAAKNLKEKELAQTGAADTAEQPGPSPV